MPSNLFPSSFTNPATLPTPSIEVAGTWNGTYVPNTQAVFERLLIQSASSGPDVFEFETPYGDVIEPGEAFTVVDPLDLIGSWVTFTLTVGGVDTVVFWGQIRGETRSTMGSDDDTALGGSTPVPKGFQRWTAYGGLEQLARTYVSKSYWVRSVSGTPTTIEVGWTPGFNMRDSQGLFMGNRSAALAPDDAGTGGSFDFGGTDLWTRRAAMDYLLKRFLNNGSGPVWTISDPTGSLNSNLKLQELGITTTVAKLFDAIVRDREGLDYRIVPQFGGGGAPAGYQVLVFTLTAATVSYGGASLPANGNTVNFDTSKAQALEGQLLVARDGTYQVSRIRILGDRVLVCATLLGPTLSGHSADNIRTSANASLVGKWSSTDEAAYKAGDSTAATLEDDEENHDAARAAEKFQPVWQRYGLPVGWARVTGWLPSFSATMALTGSAAPYQDALRETLSWTPLQEGWDYTGSSPVNNNPASSPQQDMKPPFAACEDRARFEKEATTVPPGTSTLYYQLTHKLGLSLSALKKDFGVLFHASPNHRLARTYWDSTPSSAWASSKFEPDDDDRAINPNTLAATVAWRTDTRFLLEYVIGSGDDGTVVEVEAKDAQAWVLAPTTLVDVVEGTPVYSPGSAKVLRNDVALYAPMMCGLIARYTNSRARISASFKGHYPLWVAFVGQILHATEAGASGNTVDAPITSLEMTSGRDNTSPKTTIKAGYVK